MCNKKRLTILLAATALLAYPAQLLMAEDESVEESVVSVGEEGSVQPLSPLTFSVPSKGIKIQKNVHSRSDLDRYTVILSEVSTIQGIDKDNKKTPYMLSAFLPLWKSSDPTKVRTAKAKVSGSPELALLLSSPVVVDEGTVHFDAAFRGKGESKKAQLPKELKVADVMEIEGPQGVIFEVMKETVHPPAQLHSINVMGELKDVKVGKDKDGPHVLLTFRGKKVPEFESTPLKTTADSRSLAIAERDLMKHAKDTVLNLGGNGLSFISTIHPRSVKALDPETLRVNFDPKDKQQIEAISYYAKIFEGREKEHKGDFRGGFVVFSNYSPPPTLSHEKAAPGKKETYFLFAQNGVTFTAEEGKAQATDAEKKYSLTLHNVTKVVGVDKKGGQRDYRDGDIQKIVGKGHPPFRPNGSFILPGTSGETSYVVLSFDDAKVDVKTRDITLEVSFLQAASSRKGVHAIPAPFTGDTTPLTIKGPIQVYLDYGGGGGGHRG